MIILTDAPDAPAPRLTSPSWLMKEALRLMQRSMNVQRDLRAQWRVEELRRSCGSATTIAGATVGNTITVRKPESYSIVPS